ncbi:MAG: Gfo/Idh/MocA family oxidoreductase [Candidatus Hydrogenedentes bacterium]|nr:Gfo/Idh/MocA family oxidoreductase [Candidatus Hydrogenedentota bacterium]
MSIRLGIAGVRRGRSFLGALRAAELEAVAAMDPDRVVLDQFGELAGIPPGGRYTNYERLIAHGIDAVILGSPMPNHAPQAIMALQNNIHVLSEVTAAVTFDQCRRLRDAARVSRAAYMMAENYTYQKFCQIVKAMAHAGLFGELYYAEGQYLHDVRDLAHRPDGTFTWRKRWQLDRRGITYPTHSIGPVLQWMQDRIVSLSARGSGNHTDENYTGDDTAVMLCHTTKGGLVEIRTDLHSRRPHNMNYHLLQGTQGCYESPRGFGDDHKIYLAGRHGELKWYSLWDFESEFLPQDWRTHGETAREAGHGGGDFLEMLDFARACHGEPPAIDVYTALDWTLTGLVSELSVEKGGTPLPVPDPRTEELDRVAEVEIASGRFAWLVESVD